MTPEQDPLLRDQVRRLMGVLRQLAVARNSPLRHTSQYDAALWLVDAQDHCTVHMPEGPGAELIRVARVPREPEPEAPRELRPWIRPAPESDAVPEPALRDRARVAGEDRYLAQSPEIGAAFESWLATTWRPWAEGERVRRPRLRLFEDLFNMHRLAADRPESIELVLASGLLHFPSSAEQRELSIHLVTQPVRIEQDAATGEMVCALSADDGVHLEGDELLSGLPMFDGSGSAVLRERLLELAESPLALGVATFLKEWQPRALTIACTVHDGWERPSGPRPQLGVTPAIVARRRGSFALRAYYDAMTKSLADPDRPVPLGLAQLVRAIEPEDRLAWLERAGATAAADLAADPLFPLPANEEQAAIITRLGSDTGVVVEGPPGTGKTHTIANLVSALLAQGQRVLVTSEKAQALRVLRDKLPAGMQELCVSITDASAKGNSDLAKSVATIAAQHTEFNPRRADRVIADLAARRAEARRRRVELLEDIRALREAETYQHPEVAPGYRGTLSAIVRAVAETAESDGWVPGPASGELPLTEAELRELLALVAAETAERRARRAQRFPATVPLSVDVFAGLVSRIQAGDAARSGQGGDLVAVLERLPPESLRRLEPVCREVAEAARQVRSQQGLTDWSLRTADLLLTGNLLHPWQRALEQFGAVDAATRHDHDTDYADVRVAPTVDPGVAAPVFERFAAHLAEGAGLRRMFKSAAQKEAETHAGGVVVNGAPPSTAAAAAAAGHHLRFVEIARRFDAAFRPLSMGLPTIIDRPTALEAMHSIRRAGLAVDRLLGAAADLRNLLIVLPPSDRPHLDRVPDLERVSTVALAVGNARSAALAQAEVEAAAAELRAAAPSAERAPETSALVDSLHTLDPAEYERALRALAHGRDDQAAQSRCDQLRARLRAASAALADAVESTADDPSWAGRLSRWPQAWARAGTVGWLADQTSVGREQQLDAELAVAVSDLHRLTGELAAAQAWKACVRRMNAEQVQALQSYRSAMAKVGKGTGKFAERFRRSAREAMAVAQSAVPAWVMPIQQALASVPPDPDTFDVVIVDEASQADLTSAFLLWLAPRVIVVGDDKQCTPSEVASGALQPVFDRLDAELHDIPSYLRDAFTPKDSLFSLLRTRFGQVVRLREHFRCMPEIITWSSNMFYRDAPLVPLRQFGADRLPPLRHTYVSGAEVQGTSGRVANRAEALAIAESVRACLDDPAYDGRTFGIVVLQASPTQVDIINHELRQRVSVAEWEERRIRVGTAPDFQGDERHVIWLSMVAAPNSPLIALTRDTYQQSYNVAASRAQDQLWLFHSITPDLLRETDLRRALLSYVLSEGSTTLEPELTDVDPDRRHDRFDSLFEQRVFLDLVARGYHVTPQVESNRRRIDLVVTGAAAKLAVECDGEAFHTTPEQRAADLDREQELKRCGWTFERIRESIYYLDRVQALLPVWATLDRLGIGPLGAAQGGTWTPPADTRPDVIDEPAVITERLPPTVVVPVPAPVLAPPRPATRPHAGQREPRTDELPVVAPAVAEPEAGKPKPLTVEAQRNVVLRAGVENRLADDSVSELLGISCNDARRLLDGMVHDGLLYRRRGYARPHYEIAEEEPGATPDVSAPSARPAPPQEPVQSRVTGPAAPLVAPAVLVEPPVVVPVSPPEPVIELPVDEPQKAGDNELSDKEYLLQLAQRRALTTVWVAEQLALGMAQARLLLQEMVNDGLLIKTGQTRGTRYILPGRTSPGTPAARKNPAAAPASAPEVRPVPAAAPPRAGSAQPRRAAVSPVQREWIERSAEQGRLTVEMVRSHFGIGFVQAGELLATLVDESVLERRGHGRDTHFVRSRTAGPAPPPAPEPTAPATRASANPAAEPDAAAEFEREMRRLYERTLKETGYRATRLLSLVSEHGGLGAARQLLNAGSVSAGFTELWERRRLDLTVEAIVLNPRYAALFEKSERETAEYRLSQHDYAVPAAGC